MTNNLPAIVAKFVVILFRNQRRTMRKTVLILAVLMGLFATPLCAAYRIEATVVGAERVMAYLARYEGVTPVNIDSARFNEKGVVVLVNAKMILPGGLYLLQFNAGSQPYIEFLVSGDAKFDLNIFANTLNIEKTLKYSKSDENEGSRKYIEGQQRISRKMQILQQRFQQLQNNPDSVSSIQKQYIDLMQEQKSQSEAIIAEYKGSFLATLVRAAMEPEVSQFDVPEGSSNPDSIRQCMFMAYAEKHFFDNFDLADPRIINAPILDNRLMVFFQQVMLRESADNIDAAIDELLARAEKTEPVYRYILTWLYERYTDSPIEGHHVVGMHLCELMSDSTKVTWLTDRDKTRLKQNIRKYKLNPIGSVATDLTLQTIDGEFKTLHKVNAPVTVLYFFNPGCGNCRTTTPVLHKVYEKYKDQGVEVFAVYPDKDVAAWRKYVEESGYTDWTNVWDAEGTSDIYEKYSLHAIPQIYVLDENKVVKYKDVYVDDLERVIAVVFSQLPKSEVQVQPAPQLQLQEDVKAKSKSKKSKK